MYCPKCGKAVDSNGRFCTSCGSQVGAGVLPPEAVYPVGVYAQGKLVRPRHSRMIAGVCSAFALQYGWDVTLVRLLTAVAALCTSGAVGLAYIAAWIVIPEAAYALPSGSMSGVGAVGSMPPPGPGIPHDPAGGSAA